MRRREPVAVAAAARGEDMSWLIGAGTFSAAFAEIRAMRQPVTREQFYALRARRAREARDWCTARGLDYGETVNALIRQAQKHTNDAEETDR